MLTYNYYYYSFRHIKQGKKKFPKNSNPECPDINLLIMVVIFIRIIWQIIKIRDHQDEK